MSYSVCLEGNHKSHAAVHLKSCTIQDMHFKIDDTKHTLDMTAKSCPHQLIGIPNESHTL